MVTSASAACSAVKERFRAEAGEHTVTLANGVTAGLITELLMRFLG